MQAASPRRSHSLIRMEFEDVLSVLLGWMGREIEVGTHGADGARPVTALEARGILRRGEDFEEDAVRRGPIVFYLADPAGDPVASFRLYRSAYAGGGWFDDEQVVLEIRSGVIQLLVDRRRRARAERPITRNYVNSHRIQPRPSNRA
jgi:hypothetical protein